MGACQPTHTCSRRTAALRSAAGDGSKPACSSACCTVTPSASAASSMPGVKGECGQGNAGIEADGPTMQSEQRRTWLLP